MQDWVGESEKRQKREFMIVYGEGVKTREREREK